MGLCSVGSVLSDWWETGLGLQCKFCGFLQSFKGQDPFQTVHQDIYESLW